MVRRTRTAPRAARRASLVCALALCAAWPAGAQIIRVPRSTPEPTAWAALSVGLWQSQRVFDGRTNSAWLLDRSNALQWRGALEKGIRNQSSIGVVGSYARVPFTYARYRSDVAQPAESCERCDADVTVTSLALSFHAGGGEGLFQVIEALAGVTRYSDFTAEDGRRLAPLDADTDLALSAGYGIGYGVSRRFQVTLVQDFGFTWHQGAGLRRGDGGARQQRVTRLGLRYGLGRQRSRV